mmetsp:Transcript_12457/g.15604  ORF Transcript_12457/g.15604 Transcript_12457/m.15604 type:complete len:146 (+) Transcript_12457:101-538(+)|eukprot:CAMPEP_0172504624 /NCGR_PEP_ID=MMETSP1066-20121228/180432_1 /TAXON_ID=671091 /ORGANISM="Coscinodiscus wailesii, Strain CCMP2513" /LENGTH=145 /DNA_ID=CAMNT_0013280897 /DNA_START=97 /DNA_END=534 /DNA_ORIENTATION=+
MRPLFLLPSSTIPTILSSTTTTTTPLPLLINDETSLILSAAATAVTADPTIVALQSVLDPTLNILSLFMLSRIVISWYPETNLNEAPFNIIAWPTEPLLKSIRGVVPPAFGVDITPVVWLGVFTFLHEILVGEQGLLTLKIKYGI